MSGRTDADPQLPIAFGDEKTSGREPMLPGAAPDSERLTAELREAVEGLYAAFERYPLRDFVEGCECCIGEPENRLLHARPLRELQNEHLSHFALKAMTTWGSEADFKHFLPRLFELMAFDDIGIDSEIVAGKLRYANWTAWPPAERAAVERYLAALWPAYLATFPSATLTFASAGPLLCTLGQVLDNLRPLLDYWLAVPCLPHLQHLALWVELESWSGLTPDRLRIDAFWDGRETQMAQVAGRLCDPAIPEILEQAFFRYADEPFAGDIARAVDHWRWARGL